MHHHHQEFVPNSKLSVEYSTSALLLARFDGRVIIPFSEALDALSYHVPTARNQRSQGTFPIPVITRGKRLYIELSELLRYTSGKKKRGRKTKAEKLAGQGGAQ
jgi:hypothetical protein